MPDLFLKNIKPMLDVFVETTEWVKRQKHPTEDLYIYNYTPQAQFEPEAFQARTVRLARGLIVDGKGKIVARPFEKFFNYGDPVVGPLKMDEPATVYDKADGSLGILYQKSDGTYAIATRGSFNSDQAIHATELWNLKYADHWKPRKGRTFLFEIVYPENRIVLDYGDLDDLILLGAVDNKTGDIYSPEIYDWPGPVVEAMPYNTLGEALEAEPRENREGVVITFYNESPQRMVKIKQEDYVQLHKTIFGLNEQTVWEILRSGETVSSLIFKLPDEFHEWVETVSHVLLEQKMGIEFYAQSKYAQILRSQYYDHNKYPRDARKEFAEMAKQERYPSLLFMLLDGKDTDEAIWKMIKPSGENKPWTFRSEDTA